MTDTLKGYAILDPDVCLICDGKAKATKCLHICEGCGDHHLRVGKYGGRFTYTRTADEIGTATATVSVRLGVSFATARKYVPQVVEYSDLFNQFLGAITGCLLEKPGYVWKCDKSPVPVGYLNRQHGDPWCADCLLMEFAVYEDHRFGYKSGTLYEAIEAQVKQREVAKRRAEVEGLSLDEIIEGKIR